jgi:uncharacterized protein YndB with AHSA1/START domain
MLKRILLVVVALVICILGYAATRPDSFSVERKITINAPAEKIYANINDFNAWAQWSPWAKLDPAMKLTLGGAPSGVGSTYQWVGNSDVGEGRMEITESTPSSKVVIKLDFLKPFESIGNVTTFSITPSGTGSEVSWLMNGPSPYVSKLMGVFVSMDKMIGKDFESGLSQLKSLSEK